VSLATCTCGLGSQLSEAGGGEKLGVALHAIVVLGPGEPISGAVVSCTVMVWLAVLLLLQ
jgi:hypothetical protein